MANSTQLDAALDLMRRLPPHNCPKHLGDIIHLAPHLCDDLLSMVDQPLQVAKDKETGRDYLICDYNRDVDSYRSPWSNTYEPPLADAAFPPENLRKLEIETNASFQAYSDLYFEGALSSVYFWELEKDFACAILIKKQADGISVHGCWDSIHVVEYKGSSQKNAGKYKLTSTIILWLQTDNDKVGEMKMVGSLTRQSESDGTCSSDIVSHMPNIGKLVEENESRMRSSLDNIYFGKTRQVVGDLRTIESATERGAREKVAEELRSDLVNRDAGKVSEVENR